MKRFYTIGHSNHSIERLLELLGSFRITLLADARTFASSRFNPQFNGKALREAVEAAGITYYYCGKALGGKEEATPEVFAAGISQIEGLAEQYRVALLCAEEDPARCHRHTLLATALVARRHQVRHIRGNGEVQTAEQIGGVAEQMGLF